MAEKTKEYQLLIADDDVGFRQTLRSIFEQHFPVLEAESGEEALELTEQHHFDIALIDMHMHVLTGLETLKILRSMHILIPCILITADATDELRRRASEADAFSVLAKPVTRKQVVTTVSDAIRTAYDDHDVLNRLLS